MIDRPITTDVLRQAAAALEEAGDLPDIDSPAQAHREATLRVFVRHGRDAEPSEAMYGPDADPANHPLYPDAERVIRESRARGAGSPSFAIPRGPAPCARGTRNR